MRRLTFTPVSGQEGIVYKLCFKVTDTNLPLVSLSKCVTLNVSAPVVKFSVDTAATVERAVGVNCPVLLRLVALDGGGSNYCMAMFQVLSLLALLVQKVQILTAVATTAWACFNGRL